MYDDLKPHPLKIWILQNKAKCTVYGAVCFALGAIAHALLG